MKAADLARLFKEPRPKDIALSDATAAQIHDLNTRARESIFQLCWWAYGLRRYHLVKKTAGTKKVGSNKQSLEYSPAFTRWYAKHKLELVYGTLSNFTAHAFAGRLLIYVRWQFPKGEAYLAQLPHTVRGLYELSHVLGDRGEKVVPEAHAKLFRWFTTPRQDGSGASVHLLHPQITISEIQHLVRGNNKTSSPTTKSTRSDYVTISSVLVSKADLLAFVKATGAKKRGTPTLAHIKAFAADLKKLIAQYNGGRNSLVIESHMDEVEQTYQDRLRYDKHL